MEAQRKCTWCEYLNELRSAGMASDVKRFVESLPKKLRVSEEEHERRLAIFKQCDKCEDGVCWYCGCFVVARASRNDKSCPWPGGGKW